IAYINEIAALCEKVGADSKELEKALKSDERIGPRAYLAAGGPFAGGTLARDLSFLAEVGRQVQVPTPLLEAVKTSNDMHKDWSRCWLESLLGSLCGRRVALLGLAYKPRTDTLRRSAAVELGLWLSAQQAEVRGFDPAVKRLPPELARHITLAASATEAVEGA